MVFAGRGSLLCQLLGPQAQPPTAESQEALVCMFLEAASIALTLAMRSCARRDRRHPWGSR